MKNALANFFPGYFALVMSTGIVSIAAHLLEMNGVARALLPLNVVFYVVLWGITLVRVACYPRRVLDDLISHARGPSFLSAAAGTFVLGGQVALLTGRLDIAVGLWCFGIALWTGLIYTFFTAVTVREPKPGLDEGINGSWLLVTVATEGICVLGTVVAPAFADRGPVLFAALAAFMLGGMLYIVIIALILYRWMFFSMRAEMLTPPYWINMGAMAITTLAGARLLLAAQEYPPLQSLSHFLTGFTVLFWATATWWIPLLVSVGIWRRLVQRVRFVYDPQNWSMVFPLGMYTVATFTYAKASGFGFLLVVPRVFVYISMIAWGLTFAGMARHVVRGIARRHA